jgi:hypothetical protein
MPRHEAGQCEADHRGGGRLELESVPPSERATAAQPAPVLSDKHAADAVMPASRGREARAPSDIKAKARSTERPSEKDREKCREGSRCLLRGERGERVATNAVGRLSATHARSSRSGTPRVIHAAAKLSRSSPGRRSRKANVGATALPHAGRRSAQMPCGVIGRSSR